MKRFACPTERIGEKVIPLGGLPLKLNLFDIAQ